MGRARLDGIEPPTLGFEDSGAHKPLERTALKPSQIARLAEVVLNAAAHDRLHWLAGEVIAGRLTLAEAELQAVQL